MNADALIREKEVVLKGELMSLLADLKAAPASQMMVHKGKLDSWFVTNRKELRNIGIGVAGSLGSAGFTVYQLASHGVLASVCWTQWLGVVGASIQFGVACYSLASSVTDYCDTSASMKSWNATLDRCQSEIRALEEDYREFLELVMQLGKGNMDKDGILLCYQTLAEQVSRAVQIRQELTGVRQEVCEGQKKTNQNIVLGASTGSASAATSIGVGIGIAFCLNPVGLVILVCITSISGAAALTAGVATGVSASNLSRLNDIDARVLSVLQDLDAVTSKIEQLRAVVQQSHEGHAQFRKQLKGALAEEKRKLELAQAEARRRDLAADAEIAELRRKLALAQSRQ